MRTGKSSRMTKASYIILWIVAAAAAAAAMLYIELLAHTKEVLRYEVGRRTGEVISEAIDGCLSQQGGNCITVVTDEQGIVCYAETNTAAVNELENSLKIAVNRALEQMTESDISVSFGTLIGFAPLVGKGPKIGIGLEQHGIAEVKLESEFDTAGVNQTRHRLTLTINAELMAMLAGSSETVTSMDEYIVSETLISGRPLFG